jgi:hypothetical protein
MTVNRVSCPRCTTAFRAETVPGSEASFRCPRCQTVFSAPRTQAGLTPGGASAPIPSEVRESRKKRKRSGRKSAAASRTRLVIALVLGGTFFAICLPVVGVGLYWAFGRKTGEGLTAIEQALTGSSASPETRRRLVGTWESKEAPKGAGRRSPVISFNEDGTVYLESGMGEFAKMFPSLKLVGDFDIHLPARCITYRLPADDRLELDVDLGDLGRKLGADPVTAARDYRKKESVTIAVSDTELSITNDQGKTMKFRRLE